MIVAMVFLVLPSENGPGCAEYSSCLDGQPKKIFNYSRGLFWDALVHVRKC